MTQRPALAVATVVVAIAGAWAAPAGAESARAKLECGERPCGKHDVNPQQGVAHHQAVALLVEGADKVQLENVRLHGFQALPGRIQQHLRIARSPPIPH